MLTAPVVPASTCINATEAMPVFGYRAPGAVRTDRDCFAFKPQYRMAKVCEDKLCKGRCKKTNLGRGSCLRFSDRADANIREFAASVALRR